MSDIQEVSGNLHAGKGRFAVVAARFNGRLVETLLEGAVDCLVRHGADPADIVVVQVPGAWEIPLALDLLAKQSRFTALVALGLVIRGETPHFDYVCAQCAAGVQQVSLAHGLPIGFGVLTCDSTAQAQERAGGKAGNKGWDAALAALEMADLLPRLEP
jgi:6,7-dimethyl-8-ribityllumazine synthase